jgi:TolB-like protein
MTAPDIFLSYNREDQARAKLFADAFATAGLNVWWDTALRSGEAYDEVTEAALRAAKAVVVLWSPRSVVSRWVRAEATIADRCKTLVPVTIEACDRPIMFELTQTAELSHWAGDVADRAWLAFLSDVRRFIGGETTSPAGNAAPPAATEAKHFTPALAVLPIGTRLGDADDDAGFAADLTDELLTALSRHSLLRILPGTMSSAWHRKLTDLRPVARDLDARYLLEGSLRRTGGEFRVTIKLIEGDSGKQLWSQKWQRPLAELGDIPDDLASAIAVPTGDRLLWLEYDRAAEKTQDLTAWAHFGRSNHAAAKATTASLKIAIDEARQAVTLAPDFGLPHAMLAFALAASAIVSGDDDGVKAAEARRHLNIALNTDRTTARVFIAAGGAAVLIGDPETGLRLLERARALDPHDGSIHFYLLIANLFLGRLPETLSESDRYIEWVTSEALFGWVLMYRSAAHFLADETEAAVAASQQCLHFIPNGDIALVWLVAHAALRGENAQARAHLARFRVLEPEYTLASGLSFVARLLMADKAKATEAQKAFSRIWAEVEGGA